MKAACTVVVMALAEALACGGKGESGSSPGSGTPANVTCAAGPNGCRCSSTPLSLTSFETPVDNCDDSPGWQCCTDLDSAGTVGVCQCTSYVCASTDTNCECHWRADDPGADGISASGCTNTHGNLSFAYKGVCCDLGQSCSCEGTDSSGATVVCASGTTKTNCGGTGTTRTCTSSTSRPSCAGLTWRR